MAIVVLRPEFEDRVKEEDIINHVRAFVDEGVIPKWWVPDKVIFVDELPKTGAAKIDKKVLRDRYRDVLIKR